MQKEHFVTLERVVVEIRQLFGVSHVLDQLLPAHQVLGAILSIIILTVLDDTPFTTYLPTHEQKASWPSAAIAVLRSRTHKSDALLVNDTVLPLMAMHQCRFFSSLPICLCRVGRSRRAPM